MSSVVDEPPPRPGRHMSVRALLAGFVIVLMTAGALSWIGLLQLDRVRDAFADAANGRSLGDLPEITPSEAGKPQTIMLLGTDGRLGADAGSGQRSDTIILVRLDARAEAITVMSIPRDFKVEINGYTDKINAAYSAGGAGLTLKTVKDLLSRPGEPFKINHIVEVNFTGFRDIVNYFGCAYVDIDRDYYNDVTGPGGYAAIDVNEGYQQVCGNNALAYVRYRHTDSDIVRGARQQDFMRQLLRSPGVRRKLSIGNVESLARLAGKYTTTDKALLESDTAAISLFKLALAVADKPVQQVPFGAGRLADDAGYLVASKSAINETLEAFMNPKTVTEEEAKEPPEESDSDEDGKGKKKKKKKDSEPSLPAGLTSFADTGKAMAITNQRLLSFPFYYPELGASTASYVEDAPRRYTIPVGKKEYQSYRLYLALGPAGEYYGVQGTTWKDPPILQGPHDVVEREGKELEVFYDGTKVRQVAYRTKKGVYWVSNTLTRDLDKARMIAIAGSLARLGSG
jgi:polyisoprenyl-teichoic acid--peptidoglycan teichoic acid transferase